MDRIVLSLPDDFHLHLRDGAALTSIMKSEPRVPVDIATRYSYYCYYY